MPALENRVTQEDRRALSQRTKRQVAVLQSMKATQPAQIGMRLRRVADKMGQIALDASLPTEERIAAAKAMMDAQSQLLDVIGWPKRPTAPTPKPGRLPPPVDITPETVQDAQVVSPE